MLFFRRHPELFSRHPLQLLHVAPEPRLEKFFRDRCGDGYLSADIYRSDVMERMDVMAINRPDASFDAVYCSHVLQDVPDDARALREIFRVLRPGGWAVLNVPLFSDAGTRAIVGTNRGNERPLEQLRHYGEDYAALLQRTGFEVSVLRPEDVQDPDETRNPVLDHPMTGVVHFVRKPAAQ
jgi:SAM-dependent methyltransferase